MTSGDPPPRRIGDAGAESSAPAVGPPPVLRCRPIADDDIDGVVALLTRGFRERDAAYWRRGLDRMAARAIPDGCPRFGHVMTADGRMVGVVLTIFSASRDPEGTEDWCNLSSWYVDPAFRPYATLLDRVAMKRARTTYTNISAAPHTVPGHEARGFRRIGAGQVLAAPILARRVPGARLRAVAPDDALPELPPSERDLLRDHAAYGCIALVGTDARGAAEGFIFARHPVQRIKWRLGFSPVHYGQLVHCRSPEALPRFSRALGRHLLLRHGLPWILVDADSPIAGLPGRFRPGWGLRLRRGRDHVPPGDLAYSEMAMFGP